jgi:phospholipid transport system substrate-binding protein
MIHRSRLLTAAIVVLVLGIGGAAAAEGPDAVVKRVTLAVMNKAKGHPRHFLSAVLPDIAPVVDVPRMTALAAGRFWRDATPDQQRELISEFRTIVIGTYARALASVSGQQVSFTPFRANPSVTSVEIEAQFLGPGGRSTPISDRLERTPTGWAIYDIWLGGAWLVETYKRIFASEIGRGGIDGLIRSLTAKSRSLAARDN